MVRAWCIHYLSGQHVLCGVVRKDFCVSQTSNSPLLRRDLIYSLDSIHPEGIKNEQTTDNYRRRSVGDRNRCGDIYYLARPAVWTVYYFINTLCSLHGSISCWRNCFNDFRRNNWKKRVIKKHYFSTAEIFDFSKFSSIAPTKRSASLPSLKMTMQGMPRMSYFWAKS